MTFTPTPTLVFLGVGKAAADQAGAVYSVPSTSTPILGALVVPGDPTAQLPAALIRTQKAGGRAI